MAIDFPLNPAPGAQYSYGERSWRFNGNAWDLLYVEELLREVRIDTTIANTLYIGKALMDSAEASAVWTIRKSTFNSAGVRTSIGTAVNVSWTGRTGHVYS
jgi:hypothetical protein